MEDENDPKKTRLALVPKLKEKMEEYLQDCAHVAGLEDGRWRKQQKKELTQVREQMSHDVADIRGLVLNKMGEMEMKLEELKEANAKQTEELKKANAMQLEEALKKAMRLNDNSLRFDTDSMRSTL